MVKDMTEVDNEESPDRTTLSVPKHFAETLRRDYDGPNDMERLKEWAGKRKDLAADGDTKSDAEKLLSYNRPSDRDVERLEELARTIEEEIDIEAKAVSMNYDLLKLGVFLRDLDEESEICQSAARVLKKFE